MVNFGLRSNVVVKMACDPSLVEAKRRRSAAMGPIAAARNYVGAVAKRGRQESPIARRDRADRYPVEPFAGSRSQAA
jgi:hypothetical protein